MHRKVLADGICKALQAVPELHPLIELNEDQAVQTVAVFQPDVVIMEASESRSDSVRALLQKADVLRSRWPDIKVLILSSRNAEAVEQRCG